MRIAHKTLKVLCECKQNSYLSFILLSYFFVCCMGKCVMIDDPLLWNYVQRWIFADKCERAPRIAAGRWMFCVGVGLLLLMDIQIQNNGLHKPKWECVIVKEEHYDQCFMHYSAHSLNSIHSMRCKRHIVF